MVIADQPLLPLKTSWLRCAVVQVSDAAPEEIQRNIERVLSFSLEHDGIIISVLSSLAFVSFGTHEFNKQKSDSDSKSFATHLISSLGEDARAVAFEGNIAHGIIGNARLIYTVLVPNLDRVLTALLGTKFGCLCDLGSL